MLAGWMDDVASTLLLSIYLCVHVSWLQNLKLDWNLGTTLATTEHASWLCCCCYYALCDHACCKDTF